MTGQYCGCGCDPFESPARRGARVAFRRAAWWWLAFAAAASLGWWPWPAAVCLAKVVVELVLGCLDARCDARRPALILQEPSGRDLTP